MSGVLSDALHSSVQERVKAVSWFCTEVLKALPGRTKVGLYQHSGYVWIVQFPTSQKNSRKMCENNPYAYVV